jgi:hypothetical protein
MTQYHLAVFPLIFHTLPIEPSVHLTHHILYVLVGGQVHISHIIGHGRYLEGNFMASETKYGALWKLEWIWSVATLNLECQLKSH